MTNKVYYYIIQMTTDLSDITDFLNYQLSIKTIGCLIFLGGLIFLVFVIILFGGVNNTVNYLIKIIESTKNSISSKNTKENMCNYKQNDNNDNNADDDDDE